MIIASILENQEFEKRIAITIETAKKYIDLGFEVILSENYANHIGINDQEYSKLGVKIFKDEKEIIKKANIIVQLGLLSDENNKLLTDGQILIGILNPFSNKNKIDDLIKQKINVFSLELLPRITRAQSMDVLSSQANLAGYKAVIDAFAYFEKAIPMMMTAAGKGFGGWSGSGGSSSNCYCKKNGCNCFFNRCKNSFKRASGEFGRKIFDRRRFRKFRN